MTWVRNTRLEGRTLVRINEDEIARRRRGSVGFRLLGAFAVVGATASVGFIIGGEVCEAAFVLVGSIFAALIIAPIFSGAP